MALSARAGIDLSGHRFRYAVVQTGRSGNRLLRLGECSFDFDVVAALGEAADPSDRGILLDGLREALGPEPPQALRFVVHPPVATSFLSVTDGQDVETVAHRDARLLGLLDDESTTVRVDHLDRDRGMELVSLLPHRLSEAVGRVCADLGAVAFELVPGLLVSGEAIRAAHPAAAAVIGFGLYGGGVEVAGFESGLWKVGASTTAAGGAGAIVLQRVLEAGVIADPDHVERFRFGTGSPDGEFPGMDAIVPFDGLTAVRYDEAGIDPDTDRSLFTAAVGAAIL